MLGVRQPVACLFQSSAHCDHALLRHLSGCSASSSGSQQQRQLLQQALLTSGSQPRLRYEPHCVGSTPSVKLHAASQMAETAARPAEKLSEQGKRVLWTHLGTNSWQAEFPNSGVTVLVDPWLVGELTFAGQNWVFEGKKGLDPPLDVDAIAAKADFILLSQGLPDHAHVPTLQRLRKTLPVIASPAGARVAASCGFKQVYELDHDQSMTFCDGKLSIRATIGALVGPPWDHRENGFLIKETCNRGISIYYEPHCDYDDKSLVDVGELDVCITPAVDQLVTLYPLVQGGLNIARLVKRLQPKLVIPLQNAEFPASGPLSKLIWQQESNETLPARLQAANISGVRVEQCKPVGEAMDLRF